MRVLQARVMMYCVLLTGAKPETDPVHSDWRNGSLQNVQRLINGCWLKSCDRATTRVRPTEWNRRQANLFCFNFWLWWINFDKVNEPIILNAKQPLEHLWVHNNNVKKKKRKKEKATTRHAHNSYLIAISWLFWEGMWTRWI